MPGGQGASSGKGGSTQRYWSYLDLAVDVAVFSRLGDHPKHAPVDVLLDVLLD